MTNKELCQMCTEYSSDTRCENEDNCKLLNILRENEKLKKENRSLRQKNSESELRMSYMYDPNCIGDRHEMGG